MRDHLWSHVRDSACSFHPSRGGLVAGGLVWLELAQPKVRHLGDEATLVHLCLANYNSLWQKHCLSFASSVTRKVLCWK